MYYSVKNLKLLIPPHNHIPYTSQPTVPWVAVVPLRSESEAKLAGNPQSGFVRGQLILVNYTDPLFLLIVIQYANLYL